MCCLYQNSPETTDSMKDNELFEKEKETFELSATEKVDTPFIDRTISPVGQIRKDLERDDDYVEVISKGNICEPQVDGIENVGDNKDIHPETNDREEGNVQEDIHGVFNRICVKNMIMTCVDKLGTEYERGACRKVVSVGPKFVTGLIEETTEDVVEDMEVLIEVHMAFSCHMLKCV